MKTFSSFIIFFFAIAQASGQRYVDIVKVYAGTTSVNHFKNSDSTTRLQELGLDLTIPIVLNSSDAVLTGLTYERIQTRLFEGRPVETISAAGLKMGFSKKYSDQWSGTFMLLPKLASDFVRLTRKAFQVGGIVLMKYTNNENLNYKLGAYYNSELFGPFFVPLIGLYHLSENKKFEINVTLPFQMDMNYQLQHRFVVGINFLGQIRSYHLTKIPGSETSGYVVKATNDVYGYLKFSITKEVSIQAKAGYSIGRSYRVYADADKIDVGSVLLKVGDDRQQLNTDFSNGFVGQISLLYRFVQD